MPSKADMLDALLKGANGDFLGLDEESSQVENALVWILPVPFDGSSTWLKGADQGPKALLAASEQVELYDMESHAEVHRLGIATLPQLPCPADLDPAELADTVEGLVAEIFRRGRFPVLLGGEHSVSIGAIRAAQKSHEGLGVVQIDAHADTREAYHGNSCNHACVMARAREGGPIIQVGIRSMDAEELERMDTKRVHPAHVIHADPDWVKRIVPQLSARTWLTVDLDGFDSSLMPATGTPEPGGLFWHQVMELVRALSEHTEVVGFDVVELKPLSGNEAPDFLAARLVHRLLSAFLGQKSAAKCDGPPPFPLVRDLNCSS